MKTNVVYRTFYRTFIMSAFIIAPNDQHFLGDTPKFHPVVYNIHSKREVGPEYPLAQKTYQNSIP